MIALEKAIEREQKRYQNTVDKLIDAARTKYVIPYCERTGRKFVAGMGGWSFHPSDHRETISGWNADKLPKRLREVLETDYGMFRNDCGSMMQDYKPTTYGRTRHGAQGDKNVSVTAHDVTGMSDSDKKVTLAGPKP